MTASLRDRCLRLEEPREDFEVRSLARRVWDGSIKDVSTESRKQLIEVRHTLRGRWKPFATQSRCRVVEQAHQ